MKLKTFDLNITCKKCRSTEVSLAVNQYYEITAECNKCQNSEKL